MVITCGIFIIDISGKLLICRPRGIKTQSGWTIPKGKQEPKEDLIDSALRECLEETGLDLSNYKKKMIDIGEERYSHKKKKLQGFLLHLPYKIDVKELKCMEKKDEAPEITEYELVNIKDACDRIHETQAKLLKNYLKGTK